MNLRPQTCGQSMACAGKSGFTMIELVIAMLLLSTIGIGVGTFLRNQNQQLSTGSSQEEARGSSVLAKKSLLEDIQQAAIINPGCDGNEPAGETLTKSCADIKIRGGILPLPGMDRTDVDSLTNFETPAMITNAPSSLSKDSDAIRIYRYAIPDGFNCSLTSEISNNPSSTDGSGVGAERMWVSTACGFTGDDIGSLFVLVEELSGEVFGNVFQITAVTDQSANSPPRIEIDAASANNQFNQVGGLALSGYSNAARIYPLSIVEWALEPEGTSETAGLYRREIRPDAADMIGKQSWELVQQNVEGLQFYPFTNSALAGPTEHQRTLQLDTTDINTDGYGDDEDMNGIEDILGVSPRIVTRSSRPASDGKTYDNPITSVVENDSYPRQEDKFFAAMRNATD